MEEDLRWFGKWWDRSVQPRLNQRLGLTVYPFGSAMYGAISAWTRWGCLTVSWPALGRTWAATGLGPSAWLSPNGTPWAATLLLGGRFEKRERELAAERRRAWGHGYDSTIHDPLAAR